MDSGFDTQGSPGSLARGERRLNRMPTHVEYKQDPIIGLGESLQTIIQRFRAEKLPRNRWRRAIRKVLLKNSIRRWLSTPLALTSFQQVVSETMNRIYNESCGANDLPINRWIRAIRVVMRRNMVRRSTLAMERWRWVVIEVLKRNLEHKTATLASQELDMPLVISKSVPPELPISDPKPAPATRGGDSPPQMARGRLGRNQYSRDTVSPTYGVLPSTYGLDETQTIPSIQHLLAPDGNRNARITGSTNARPNYRCQCLRFSPSEPNAIWCTCGHMNSIHSSQPPLRTTTMTTLVNPKNTTIFPAQTWERNKLLQEPPLLHSWDERSTSFVTTNDNTGEDSNLIFITRNSPSEFKSHRKMTNVHKDTMGSILRDPYTGGSSQISPSDATEKHDRDSDYESEFVAKTGYLHHHESVGLQNREEMDPTAKQPHSQEPRKRVTINGNLMRPSIKQADDPSMLQETRVNLPPAFAYTQQHQQYQRNLIPAYSYPPVDEGKSPSTSTPALHHQLPIFRSKFQPHSPPASRSHEYKSAEEAKASLSGNRPDLLPRLVHYGGHQPPTPPSPPPYPLHVSTRSTYAFDSTQSTSKNEGNIEWASIDDIAERRRIQNRIAQRNYRQKLKKRLEDLERRVADGDSADSIDVVDPDVLKYQNPDDLVVIQCVCGNTDDCRFIVPCVTCGKWQHITCYYDLAQGMKSTHQCVKCHPRKLHSGGDDTLKRPAQEDFVLDKDSLTTLSSKRPRTVGAESSIDFRDEKRSHFLELKHSIATNRSFKFTDSSESHRNAMGRRPVPSIPYSATTATSVKSEGIEKKADMHNLQESRSTAPQKVSAGVPSAETHNSHSLDISEIDLQSARAFTTDDVVAYIKQLQRQVEEKDRLLQAKDQEIERLRKAATDNIEHKALSWVPDSGVVADIEGPISAEVGVVWKRLSFSPLPFEPLDYPETFRPEGSNELQGHSIDTFTTAEPSAGDAGKAAPSFVGDTLIQDDQSSVGDGIEQSPDDLPEANTLLEFGDTLEADWTLVQAQLPENWMWDVEFHSGCWTCTPLETDIPKHYPLKIAGAPVVLPVEYQWPPIGGANPPPDPRPSAPIDCRAEMALDVVRDIFLTFEGSIGFYVLTSGLLQIMVSDDFDTTWASSHMPHKYGGLKVCYIPQNLEATMLPSSTETTRTKLALNPQTSGLSGLFRQSRTSTGSSNSTLKLNDFIEARPRANHRKEKYSGRIGLQVTRSGDPFLIMSTHIITEAILAKSHREALFGRGRGRLDKLDDDWNEHIEVWAGNEKIGVVDKSFDEQAEIYPNGFRHDVTLVKPTTPASVKNITSPIGALGWLNRESWNALRQQTSPMKILGPTEADRSAKSIKCSRPSEILVVGEGIFLNQTATTANSNSLRDHDMSTWKKLVSRALLYRVHPDFDPPNGHSGVALYAEGTREDGTEGPGIVGFQSFVQRSGHVQNFKMEGPHLEKRLQTGRVAFYGAFEVPEELKREYTIV